MLQTTVHPISAHGKMTEPALLRLLQPVTILAGVFLCSASLLVAAPRPVVFASFESQEEVSSWSTTGGATAEVSGRYTSWFNKSLEVVFPGSGSPEIGTDKVPGDWQLHEALRFFCYSSLPAELLLTLKDEHGSQVERRIHLRRGPNHVQLELAGLGGIDLRRMESVHLSRPSGLGEITAWLDRFALDRFNSILARRGRMDITYRKDVVTPHRAFARPLAAGAVRCLLVPDVENGRAVVELAQRLDLDYEAVTLGSAFGTNIWGFGDFYHKRGRTFQEYPTSVFSLAYTYLADALLNGPHYDVIVIPGSRPWGEFPEPVRREIARRVSEGAGLVLVCPRFDPQYDNSDLDGLSPLVDVEKIVWMNPNNFIVEDLDKLRRAAWRKVQKPHYITRNVPLEAFPFELMQYARSRAAGGGEVLIETDEASSYPILAVRNHGKGRVVALSYGERGLIPRIAALRQVEVEYPYWEYMYSLLARCVVWAAGRESAASIENISLTRKGVAAIEVAGSRAGDAAPRELEVVFRDSFGERIGSSRVAVPAKGSGSLEVKLPADAPGGAVLVDARLIENGLVLDWGSLIGKFPKKARIDS
ncbi:MAG: hypothetical protein U9N45_06735, partial [Gemmatimonadota bacterium]|nr:hypothetical protein [Gemmatimonadota bacterium]